MALIDTVQAHIDATVKRIAEVKVEQAAELARLADALLAARRALAFLQATPMAEDVIRYLGGLK